MRSKLVKKGDYYEGCGLYEEAYVYYLEAALNEEDGDAIFNLGVMYLNGEYVDRNYEKAFGYFRKAYELTGKVPYYDRIYDQYDEIAADKEGRRCFREYMDYLLEEGRPELYIMIGGEYGLGKIYPYDIARQIDYYEKAIDTGINVGYDYLAEIYFEGKGVPQDFEKAYRYLTSYEGADSYTKTYILAEMYRNGFYLEKDITKAKELYQAIVDDATKWNYLDTYYQMACERLKEL